MKILEINVFNYKKGGSEAVYFNTTKLLAEHGHEVVNFALKWSENLPSKFDKYFPESKETRSGVLRPIKNILTYFYHPEAAAKLEKLILAEKPDIAQVHLIWGQLTPSILSVLKKHKIPAVLTIHDYRLVCPAFLFRNGKGEVCEQCQGKHFTKCISNACCKGSKGLRVMMAAEQYFRNTFFNPAKYVTGLLYVSDFSKSIHEKYMPALKELPSLQLYNMAQNIDNASEYANNDSYFLYFGRLSSEKGVGTVIDAFSRRQELKLIVVGTGPEENALKELAASRHADNIKFVGYKSGAELENIVRGAKMILVPSECYENNPMTIIEAYSFGIPAIGARIGGVPEIVVEGKTGFQFESGNPESLCAALDKAAKSNETAFKEMSENALAFAKENFEKEQYYSKLIKFFESLVNKS